MATGFGKPVVTWPGPTRPAVRATATAPARRPPALNQPLSGPGLLQLQALAGNQAVASLVLQREGTKEGRDLDWVDRAMERVMKTTVAEAHLDSALRGIERSSWSDGKQASERVREHLSEVRLFRGAFYRGYTEWEEKGKPPLPFAALALPARELSAAVRRTDEAFSDLTLRLQAWMLDRQVQALLKKSPEILGNWDTTLRSLELGVSLAAAGISLFALMTGNPLLGIAGGVGAYAAKRVLHDLRTGWIQQAISENPSLVKEHLGEEGVESLYADKADNAVEGMSQTINVADAVDVLDLAASIAGDSLAGFSATIEAIAPEVGWAVWAIGNLVSTGRSVVGLYQGLAPADLKAKTKSLATRINLDAAAAWAFGKPGLLVAVEPRVDLLYLVAKKCRVPIAWQDLYGRFSLDATTPAKVHSAAIPTPAKPKGSSNKLWG